MLEKQAVVAGGGTNHRAGLYDAILVKENHAELAGGVGEATRLALAAAARDGVPVEVECATLAEVDDALAAGIERILLDNMSLDDLRAAVDAGAPAGPSSRPRGGVTLETVRGDRRDRRRLHLRGRADALGAGARPVADAAPAVTAC